MKNSAIKLWPLLCAVLLLLNACQKETSTSNEDEVHNENQGIRTGGALPDDPALVAKVPMIVSSEYYNSMDDALGARGGGNSGKDSDKDGIPDSKDACPTQKETVNGYQDDDGCPDTVPTTATDSDGDGIPDSVDKCPLEKETFNGYQDTDGCPDTVPDTDGDGIIDTKDLCPTEAETVNGYEDTDGCPDTPPTVTPPTTIPASFQLATPKPGYQGGEGSCVSFAVGYAVRSIEQYYKTGASSYSYSTNVYSPEFLYNQTKIDAYCSSGTGILTTLEFLKNKGVCSWQSMPYTSVDCSLMPNSSQLAEAANYKINSYSSVYTSDLAAIKTVLTNKHPLIIAFTLDNSFYGAGPDFIWKSRSSTNGPFHCVAICGYDDAKHAVKIINSWGTSWGDAGYSWIDYDFLPTLTGKVYVMNL